MISIIPIKDEKEKDELIKKYSIKGGFTDIFKTVEKDKILSIFTVTNNADNVSMENAKLFFDVQSNDGKLIVELMFRAVGSYALNRNIPKISIDLLVAKELLLKFGFKEVYNPENCSTTYTIFLTKLFHSCENC